MHIRILCLVALFSAACGKNPGAYQTAAAEHAEKQVDTTAWVEQADTLWAQRIDEAKLREALALYDQVAAVHPRDRHALLRLTRGWYFLGDSHLLEKDAKIAAWATAIERGKQCLAINTAFAARVSTEKEQDAVAVSTAEDAPCMYWLASALGKWGKIQGVAKVLGQLPAVKAYIAKVEELDPEYFHYGPARYWGAYYSASSFTKDVEKSTNYFAASVDGAPYYLPTRGLRAGQLAVMLKDFDMFARDIAYIRDFDVSGHPDLEPENLLEKKKAEALWEQRRELFFGDVVDAWEAAQGTAQ